MTIIGNFLNRVRVAVGDDRWDLASKGGAGILSVTTINGMIILLRKLIESKKFNATTPIIDLSAVASVKFKSYKSSQYSDLAAHMFKVIP